MYKNFNQFESKTMNAYLLLFGAIICEVIATSSLKLSNGFTNLTFSIITIVGYSASFYILSLALKTIPVGIAYAIWSGIGIIIISLIAWIFLKQSLDLAALIGMGFIIFGVVIINLFSNISGH
ncbi:DMT family transporter [Gilliamella apis]|uniref:DMT family transporter n=1 Tax=Gilliamella apis TaxID=1970738 RepID=UPI003F5C0643